MRPSIRSALLICAAGVASAGAASAGTLRGPLTYAGDPVAATFDPDAFRSARVFARNLDTGVSTDGTLDLAAGTWEVAGLDEGTFFVRSIASPLEGRTTVSPQAPGELTARLTDVALAAGEVREVEMPLVYAAHVTAPFDITAAPFPGSGAICPRGPAVGDSVILEWEPVPRAAEYVLLVSRLSCGGGAIVQDRYTTPGTSLEVPLATEPDEDEVVVFFTASSSDGVGVATLPTIDYGDVGTALYLHRALADGRPIHPADSSFVIQVANLPGVGSAVWTSDLVLTAPAGTRSDVTLHYTPRGADGLADVLTADVVVPAGGTRLVEDAVGTLFGRTAEAGSLEVRSDPPGSVRATTRIFTRAAAGDGTYGQGFPAVTHAEAAAVGGPEIGSGGVDTVRFRTNLALAEVWGEDATVLVRLVDADGAELGRDTFDLAPFGNTQINRVEVLAGGADLEGAQVRVTVTGGGGRVVGALSVVDEATADPTTILLRPL